MKAGCLGGLKLGITVALPAQQLENLRQRDAIFFGHWCNMSLFYNLPQACTDQTSGKGFPTECRDKLDNRDKRILFLGNSYTYYNDLPSQVTLRGALKKYIKRTEYGVASTVSTDHQSYSVN